jgi:hypothetical protein
VDEKGPRWWEIQRGPKSEELGARSEKQRQAQPTAESFAPAPRSADTLARQRRTNYDRQATVDKKSMVTPKEKLIQLKRSAWRRKGDDARAVRPRISGISYTLRIKIMRRA